jgi:hypothetical protein
MLLGAQLLAGPQTPQLTRPEVLAIARRAAEREGLKLREYHRPTVEYKAVRADRTWTVSFDGKIPIPGNHFLVWVDDRTRKAIIMRGE